MARSFVLGKWWFSKYFSSVPPRYCVTFSEIFNSMTLARYVLNNINTVIALTLTPTPFLPWHVTSYVNCPNNISYDRYDSKVLSRNNCLTESVRWKLKKNKFSIKINISYMPLHMGHLCFLYFFFGRTRVLVTWLNRKKKTNKRT